MGTVQRPSEGLVMTVFGASTCRHMPYRHRTEVTACGERGLAVAGQDELSQPIRKRSWRTGGETCHILSNQEWRSAVSLNNPVAGIILASGTGYGGGRGGVRANDVVPHVCDPCP